MPHPDQPKTRLGRQLAAGVPQKVVRDVWNRFRYGPGAPLSDERIYISPCDIKFAHRAVDRAYRRRESGMVVAGDWDQSREPLPETRAARVIHDHFVKGMSWAETGIVDYHLGKIAEKGISEGARTLEEIMARYEDLDRVYEDAQKTGTLRPRSELPGHLRREYEGIFFHIARDGEPLRTGGGRNRFAIARVLKLPKIPAQLGIIHPEAVRAGYLEQLRRP
ncbi:hypothetical protein GCM10022290_24480 [Sagittula marina]